MKSELPSMVCNTVYATKEIMWNYNKNNTEGVLLRAVSQDSFKTDSRTDMAALRSKTHRIIYIG